MSTADDQPDDKAAILTVETVAAYVASHAETIGVFRPDAVLTAKAIAGGNVNYAFCVVEEATGKSVFVKQAPEYVAIFGPDGLPLTSLRMKKEYNVYQEWKRILGADLATKYLPDIYLFDDQQMVFCMQFFDGFHLLDHELVEKGVVPSSIAIGLGEFMGKTHAATHCSMIAPEQVAVFTAEYENRAMRDIQLAYVFTKCYKEATDEQRAGLSVDEAFLQEIEALKAAYNGQQKDNLCLTHGDLHPGSVMVNLVGEVKVIDPEFTVYGPPGLDVGSLLSGYVLAAVHQKHAQNPDAVKSLNQASVAVWDAYKAAILQGGVSETIVNETIAVDTVGFAVAEVCRTALGFAGGRLWLQFEDEQVRKAAIKDALKIVGKCMIERHSGGIQLLFSAMNELAA